MNIHLQVHGVDLRARTGDLITVSIGASSVTLTHAALLEVLDLASATCALAQRVVKIAESGHGVSPVEAAPAPTAPAPAAPSAAAPSVAAPSVAAPSVAAPAPVEPPVVPVREAAVVPAAPAVETAELAAEPVEAPVPQLLGWESQQFPVDTRPGRPRSDVAATLPVVTVGSDQPQSAVAPVVQPAEIPPRRGPGRPRKVVLPVGATGAPSVPASVPGPAPVLVPASVPVPAPEPAVREADGRIGRPRSIALQVAAVAPVAARPSDGLPGRPRSTALQVVAGPRVASQPSDGLPGRPRSIPLQLVANAAIISRPSDGLPGRPRTVPVIVSASPVAARLPDGRPGRPRTQPLTVSLAAALSSVPVSRASGKPGRPRTNPLQDAPEVIRASVAADQRPGRPRTEPLAASSLATVAALRATRPVPQPSPAATSPAATAPSTRAAPRASLAADPRNITVIPPVAPKTPRVKAEKVPQAPAPRSGKQDSEEAEGPNRDAWFHVVSEWLQSGGGPRSLAEIVDFSVAKSLIDAESAETFVRTSLGRFRDQVVRTADGRYGARDSATRTAKAGRPVRRPGRAVGL